MSKLEMRLVKVCEECGQFVDADMSKICGDLDEDVCECDDCENCLEDDCENCCCEDNDMTDEELEIADLLSEYAEEIIQSYPCENCIYEILEEIAEKFRAIGFKDCQEEMRSLLDDMDEFE